ncbi:hypothetical protein [Burkholderia ambifaria]|uniref:hypothetical protein n=1 Tax=Burkholderia ambifaria TaxID=152480 RepID=UPI0012FDF7F7|nr:hypothetical protein [Burkholderia ambifaria]
MDLHQATCFLVILALVTVRTLLLKRSVDHVSPDMTALLAGVGSVVCCVLWWVGTAVFRQVPTFSFNAVGTVAGLIKGGLLAYLMLVQQRLIERSLSAASYVFPIAVGLIAVVEACCFGTVLSRGAIAAIGTLFFCGLIFFRYGHLASMQRIDKRRFVVMILLVVGFGVCDKIGIPRVGWLPYLFLTGLSNGLVIGLRRSRLTRVSLRHAVLLGGIWAVPELFFSYSLQVWLPVAFGYLAIALRVPVLMLISAWVYGEGRLREQLMFGLFAMVGVAMLFVR